MKTTRIVAVAATAALMAGLPLSGASAAPKGPSPVSACDQLSVEDPETYAFIATKPGACVSSVASVGLDALMAGAFPSRAAAVGNCKGLEAMTGGYPYQFYGGLYDDYDAVLAMLTAPPGPGPDSGFGIPVEDAVELAEGVVAAYTANSGAFVAKNRSGCVTVLQGLHGGSLLGPVLGPVSAYLEGAGGGELEG